MFYGIVFGGVVFFESEINVDIVYFRDIYVLIVVEDGVFKGKIVFVDGDVMVKS